MTRIVLCLFVLLFTWPAAAFDATKLGSLPVLHEGRVKPLETLARLCFDGLDMGERSATQLLALHLFAPANALETPLFTIRSQALRSLLKLPEQEEAYAYVQVTPALRQHKALLRQLAQKPADQYTAHERDIWQLYEQVDLLTQLSGSMSLLLPLQLPISDDLKAELQIEQEPPYRYVDLLPARARMQDKLASVIQKKGSDIESYHLRERELALLSMRLDALASGGLDNHLLRVVAGEGSQNAWLAPWQSVQREPLSLWQRAATAYAAQDQIAWDSALEALHAQFTSHSDVSGFALQLEQFYYQLDLLSLTIAIYALSLLMDALARWHASVTCLVLGLCVHLLMVAARVIILDRPPVSTLYESVLFVALVAAFMGMLFARRLRLCAPAGAGIGAFLLLISGAYIGDGDPMSMPIAVLNTNFWLATHVTIITAGYSASLLAGVLAHIALWRRRLVSLRLLQAAALWALLLTAVGTMLGGVWADQSWGRFWGWDPKENGALLLTLWLAWLLHARMTDMMNTRGFTALLAASNIIVALSWFGVNLLGIGLHSYGFTSAAALGLAAFVTAELMVITALYLHTRKGPK